MQIKEPTTYKEQLELIKEKGFLISKQEESECIRFLKQANYYRISAYFLPFHQKGGGYFSNIAFSKVQKIYEFDSQLRGLIFSVIENIEINLRTKLSYFVAHKYGALGIEFFSIGMLSYFYKDMLAEDKKAIAAEIGTAPKLLESWLRCLTDLRNRCAHYSRLYYWIFPAMPAIPKSSTILADRTLFTQLLVLKYLYPAPEKWSSKFVIPLKALIDEYDKDISLNHIGFPENWESLLNS